MNKEIYLLMQKASMKNFPEEDVKELMFLTGLDYRTLMCLMRIIDNEPNILEEDIDILINPSFYTVKNCITLARNNMENLVPSFMYEDERFLLGANIDSIPDNFLEGNTFIRRFDILPQITEISDYAFNNCSNLRELKMHEQITTIGKAAFKNCKNLLINKLPDSLQYLGEEVFKNCISITNMKIPDKTGVLSESTFENCENLAIIQFSAPISIKSKCFKKCESLSKVVGLIYEAEDESFSDCLSLKEICLVNGNIGEYAFLNCNSLETLTVLSRLKYIGPDALTGCISLKNININGFAYELKNTVGYREISKLIKSTFSNNVFKSNININNSLSIADSLKNIKEKIELS